MSVARNAGYTFMEVLVVLTIVALMSAFGVSAWRNAAMNSRISAVSSELIQAIHQARSTAMVTRSNVVLLQGPGTSASDAAVVIAGNWGPGWRMVRGGAVVNRNERSRDGDSTDLRIVVADAGGTALNGIGFSQFGRLVDGAGAGLTAATITICAPGTTSERGRAISVSLMGRVVNTNRDNPC